MQIPLPEHYVARPNKFSRSYWLESFNLLTPIRKRIGVAMLIHIAIRMKSVGMLSIIFITFYTSTVSSSPDFAVGFSFVFRINVSSFYELTLSHRCFNDAVNAFKIISFSDKLRRKFPDPTLFSFEHGTSSSPSAPSATALSIVRSALKENLCLSVTLSSLCDGHSEYYQLALKQRLLAKTAQI